MNISVRNGKPVIKLLKQEHDRLLHARDILAQLAKHGDSKDAGEASAKIEIVIKQFCGKPEPTPLLDKAEKDAS